MGEEIEYRCVSCGGAAAAVGEIPECCGRPMVKVGLDACVSAGASAEHARPMDDEEPCDDSRAG